MIVSARIGGRELALFECRADDPALHWRRYRLHDGRSAFDVRFDGVELAPDALVAAEDVAHGLIDDMVDTATLALCAENVGAMRRALALTVEYMRTRRQFGRSLADNQALRHRVIEHYRGLLNARVLTMEAAAAENDETPLERRRKIAAAKWMTGRAGRALALDALQLHGAIGLQDETPISHYAKRLVANDALFGDATYQLERFRALSTTEGTAS